MNIIQWAILDTLRKDSREGSGGAAADGVPPAVPPPVSIHGKLSGDDDDDDATVRAVNGRRVPAKRGGRC